MLERRYIKFSFCNRERNEKITTLFTKITKHKEYKITDKIASFTVPVKRLDRRVKESMECNGFKIEKQDAQHHGHTGRKIIAGLPVAKIDPFAYNDYQYGAVFLVLCEGETIRALNKDIQEKRDIMKEFCKVNKIPWDRLCHEIIKCMEKGPHCAV